MSESITKKAFSQQLLDLKQRFSRIANNLSEGTHEQKAACACGGKLLVRASKAGLFSFDLPAPPPVETPSDDDTLAWCHLWDVSMIFLSTSFPDLFPSNPCSIRWEERDSPDVGLLRVGVGEKQDWRIRVENYVVACTVLVESLVKPEGDKTTVNARMIDTLSKTPESRDWTAHQWKIHLDCAEGTVKGTPTWKALMTERTGLRLEAGGKPKDRRHRYLKRERDLRRE